MQALALPAPKTYRVTSDSRGTPRITCKKCGATSYNQNDIEQKYCGYCHQFHNLLRFLPDKKTN